MGNTTMSHLVSSLMLLCVMIMAAVVNTMPDHAKREGMGNRMVGGNSMGGGNRIPGGNRAPQYGDWYMNGMEGDGMAEAGALEWNPKGEEKKLLELLNPK